MSYIAYALELLLVVLVTSTHTIITKHQDNSFVILDILGLNFSLNNYF